MSLKVEKSLNTGEKVGFSGKITTIGSQKKIEKIEKIGLKKIDFSIFQKNRLNRFFRFDLQPYDLARAIFVVRTKREVIN